MERLLRDEFPSEVFAPEHSPHAHVSRVFVTDQRVRVWTVNGAGTPELLVDEPITGPRPEAHRGTQGGPFTIETETGMIHVERAHGCGCGSPLRALDPPAER